MRKLAIQVLGPFGVTLDSAPITAFESDKVRSLLAYLAIEANQVHRREALAALIWSNYSEERARRNLSQAIYSLRSTLCDRGTEAPSFLIVTPETIQINPDSCVWVDAVEFNRLIEECDNHPHRLLANCQPCLERLQQAVALYQGDLLEGFFLTESSAFEEWILVKRERAWQKAYRAFTNLVACHERQGRLQEALQAARRLAVLDPFDESACQMLLRLLAACDLRAEALAHYESFRSALIAELDLAPQPDTIALYEHIRKQTQAQPETFTRRTNLPASLSPLIGRESEMAELQARLLDPGCRLLSVLGPGGVGKSRLALETARGLLDRFADGVYIGFLSPLSSLEAFLPALATALGLKISPEKAPQEQVRDYLRQKELLLVLDGLEGMLESIPLIMDIMRNAPDLKILATSRVRLQSEEEQIYLLGGLACPEPDLADASDYPAVRLFASGARRVRSGFAIDSVNLADIVKICCEVQGMPLAILLAAAWVELFSPAEILAEIRQSPDFLEAEWADLPARQRSVRATFDYSWNLLDESEQEIFQALCVFRGRFSRQAAQAVGGASPGNLRRLVDKSLLMPLLDEWYVIHTLLQQFGLENLRAQPAAHQEVHHRYSDYYLGRTKEWEAGIKGARQLGTLAEMDTKINNIRPAWEWAAENRAIDRLESSVEGLCLYYELRARFQEGKSLCQETILKLDELRGPEARHLKARLATWESRYCRLLGERELARQHLDYSQALVDELADSGLEIKDVQAPINLEAGEQIFTADLAEAQRHLERSLELYRQIGDPWLTAGVLCRLGINRHHSGRYHDSDLLFHEALELYQSLGASFSIGSVKRLMADNLFRIGQPEHALELMRQVVALSETSGDRLQVIRDQRSLGLGLLWNGRFDEAQPILSQTLAQAQEIASRYDCAFNQLTFGLCLLMNAQYNLAHDHFDECLALARSDGFKREEANSLFGLGCLALVEGTPHDAQLFFQESVAVYRQVGYPDELSWVLSLNGLCLWTLGEKDRVREYILEALEISRSIRGFASALFAVSVSAVWLGADGEGEKALEVYEAAAKFPVLANSPWYDEVFGKRITTCTGAIPPEAAAAARERGRQRQLWSAVEEVYEILKTPQ